MHFDEKAELLVRRLETFMSRELAMPALLAGGLAVPVLALLFVPLAGGVYLSSYVTDFVFMLDSAWRVSSGQVSNTDFSTPIGPLYYQLLHLAQLVFGGGPEAVLAAAPLAALVAAPALILIAARRMGHGYALFLALVVTLRALTPRSMDTVSFDFTYLAVYNSLSWLLVTPVMVGALFVPERPSRVAPALEAPVMAALVVAMLLLKAHFGLVALAALGIGAIVQKGRERLAPLAALVLAGLGVALFAAADPARAAAYVEQMRQVAAASELSARVLVRLRETVTFSFVLFLASVAAIWLIEQYRKGPDGAALWRELLASLFLVAAAFALTLNNHDKALFLGLLVVLHAHLVAMRASSPKLAALGPAYRRIKFAATFAPFVLAGGWYALMDGATLAAAPAMARLHSGAEAISPRVEGLSLAEGDGGMIREYWSSLEEGARLLREKGLQSSRVLALDFVNPFPFLLDAPPPKGVLAWLDYERTYSVRQHPAPEELFADVETVMRPVGARGEAINPAMLWRLYGPYIEENYERVARSDAWEVWRRR